MIWYVLLTAAAGLYNLLYAGHCIRQKRGLAAAGGLLLGMLPIWLGMVLLSYS